MIRLKNFSIGYDRGNLLKDVDTTFPHGKLVALLGRNGSGKSTILKAIAKLHSNYKGEIIIDGTPINLWSPINFAKTLAFVNTQRPRVGNLRCSDVVALGRSPYTGWHGKISNKDNEIISNALKDVGMSQYSDRYLNTLSDGECQKIMIARAIAQKTSIILLDEPTSFLDLPTRYEIVNLLKKLTQTNNKTIIFSTHELDIAMELSDHIALINNQTLFNLPTSEMIKSGEIQKLFKTPDKYIDKYLSFLSELNT